MTIADAVLALLVVLIAWRRPSVHIHNRICQCEDIDDDGGEELDVERIPDKRVERSDVMFN